MATAGDFEVIRDTLWNNIRIDAEALAVLDSEQFQRLRYIRQLGHAFLVYPGATHTRFEHALGAYHLTRRTLGLLRERSELKAIEDDDVVLVRLAALLHDVGHYPFSHALEEAGLPSHESLAETHITHPELREVLADTGIDNVETRLISLITRSSSSPLQGLVSGSLDLDKIDYLTRDARMCGVPYGTVDVDRLIHSITLVPSEGFETVAVHEKGVSALESLLFAKYQMYRNVYWHHAVRSATVMFKRLVRRAIRRGDLETDWIANSTDEALMEALHRLPDAPLAARLRSRRLYKRLADVPAADLPLGSGSWISEKPDLLERVEDKLATELNRTPGDILLDYPAKPAMLAVDIPTLTRDGRIERMGREESSMDWPGIQRVSGQLHTSARRFRVFAAEPLRLELRALLALAERSGAQVQEDLERDVSLLAAVT
jgi:HD superfamily phosphohydrolase